MGSVSISTTIVRNTEDWAYIPIQIRVIKQKSNGKIEIYDSVIKPTKCVKGSPDIPRHLNDISLEYAPSLSTVIANIKHFVKGCKIEFGNTPEHIAKMISI